MARSLSCTASWGVPSCASTLKEATVASSTVPTTRSRVQLRWLICLSFQHARISPISAPLTSLTALPSSLGLKLNGLFEALHDIWRDLATDGDEIPNLEPKAS